ncbi:MAG: aminotransferase class III-fold pyridoxal phosphate-dependent enzyme, partial [Halobacteriovoraceae bacterium]|nr:aminotransferase class III-fold pyridoxal phosphate-dependent enzyme [Halobacteriovoraceae bacterium]
KIIKFNGCYHGHTDSMLIKAGSGLAGTAEASSAGVPSGVAEDTLILELADLAAVAECFQAHPDQIAAIIIEPLPANCGLLPQRIEFLQGLRQLSLENKSLLIFDEVISGFRMGLGGMVEKTGIVPDLTTYGKVIGGGLPVGAVAGKKQVMENLAPIGKVYQAGTLSANPLAMVGGLSTLKELTPAFYQKLEKNSEKIVTTFGQWFKEYEGGKFSHYQIVRQGSLFWLQPNSDKIEQSCNIPADLCEKFYPLFETLLNKGIYLSPNAFEIGFVSGAHDDSVCAELKKRLWD